MTSERVNKLQICHERYKDRGYTEVSVEISPSGAVVLDGCDAGSSVKEHTGGSWDLEYRVSVARDWKDTLLLHLIKDHFPGATASGAFMTYCKERGIPTEFWDSR